MRANQDFNQRNMRTSTNCFKGFDAALQCLTPVRAIVFLFDSWRDITNAYIIIRSYSSVCLLTPQK